MTSGLKLVLVFIRTLTLLIGAFSVMNVMLVSVSETRGSRRAKALGARRRSILLQFLLEHRRRRWVRAAGVLHIDLVNVAGTKPSWLINPTAGPTSTSS